jgi:hypothetical protein
VPERLFASSSNALKINDIKIADMVKLMHWAVHDARSGRGQTIGMDKTAPPSCGLRPSRRSRAALQLLDCSGEVVKAR